MDADTRKMVHDLNRAVAELQQRRERDAELLDVIAFAVAELDDQAIEAERRDAIRSVS